MKGRKVALVGSLDDGSDACTDEALKKVVETNKDKLFQSAYKLTDGDKSVYYLSQFVDPNIPSALSEADRKTYSKFVEKKAGAKGKFESEVAGTTGLECELITGQDVGTKDKVEAACANDDRCAGYYTSTTAGLGPVMAMAARGKCTLSWMKLADQPTETDVCTKFMGDKLWWTYDDSCFPGCQQDGGRSKTHFCWDKCDKGFGKCSTCPASKTCVPVTEDTCPAGWILERNDAAYPSGVCRPVCQDTTNTRRTDGRESDGYCKEKDRDCIKGYDYGSYDGNYYCKPKASKIREAYYKT